jgi:hypothetical protein
MLVIGPNHILRRGYSVSPIISKALPVQPSTKPEGNSSLTAEEKTRLIKSAISLLRSQKRF